MADKGVDLGFAEKCEDYWRLLSHYFPSKLGGPPAWLELDNLPTYESLKCSNCCKPCKFLLQIYSPGADSQSDSQNENENESTQTETQQNLPETGPNFPVDECSSSMDTLCKVNSQTYHRALFLFVCDNSTCTQHSIRCFRSQLPRKNSWYSYDPPDEDFFDDSFPYPKASDFNKTCHVCYCSANKGCSQCKKYSYCCKEHQVMHWKNGHKEECLIGPKSIKHANEVELKYFFDEYEIVTELEELSASSEKSEADALKDYEKYLKCAQVDKELSAKATKADWEAAKEVKVADKAFMEFRDRISSNPDQIIRYDRAGLPLLVSDETTPPVDIPNCQLCGGAREYEFQVLSQTLSYLHIDSTKDSLDWGTLLVYTCKSSCKIQGYAEEFVWKQDFSAKDLVEKT